MSLQLPQLAHFPPRHKWFRGGLVGALGEPGDTGWPQGPVYSHLWLTHSGSRLLT